MPFIVQHLIPEKQNLITVTESDSAQHALSLIIEHDFTKRLYSRTAEKCDLRLLKQHKSLFWNFVWGAVPPHKSVRIQQ